MADRLPLDRVATAASRVQATDRYAAYLRRDGDVQVLDRRGRRTVVVDMPMGCGAFSLGGAYLLAQCGSSMAEPPVYRLKTGERVDVHGWAGVLQRAMSPGRLVSAAGIGRNWIAVDAYSYQFSSRWYLQWRTGELVVPSGARPTEVEALSAARPRQRLCAPLRRSPLPPFLASRTDDPFYPYMYDRPWGLTLTGSGARLRRCGEKKRTSLPCARCYPMHLGASALSWPGDVGGLLELRCGREFSLRSRLGVVRSVVHTRAAVLVSVLRPAGSTDEPTRVAILRAPRPRCR